MDALIEFFHTDFSSLLTERATDKDQAAEDTLVCVACVSVCVQVTLAWLMLRFTCIPVTVMQHVGDTQT